MSKPVVVDASVLIKVFSREKERLVFEAEKLYSLIKLGKIQAFTPTFALLELLNVLSVAKRFKKDDVDTALQKLRRSGIIFVSFNIADTAQLTDLHFRYNLTAYDALYLLLAINLGCGLVTDDKKLLKVKKYCLGLKSYLQRVS